MTSPAPSNQYVLCRGCYRKLAGEDTGEKGPEPLIGVCDRCGKSDAAVIPWSRDSTPSRSS